MSNNLLLNVDDLKVHFPIRKGIFSRTRDYLYAVDGISLRLKEGETLGIVGETGCGKTTAAMAIVDLVKPNSGRIMFRGKDISDRSRLSQTEQFALRRDLQIIFQDPYSSLNPRTPLRRILEVPMKIHGLYTKAERKDRIAFLFEKVGLSPEDGNRYPHEFSGGQRQRICIARALCLNPVLIIGDEPLSALDVSIQAQIINLLADLQSEFDLSYIIITHDLTVVEYISHRIAVMYLGKIVETASYRDLYTNPLHPYSQALLSAIPVADPLRKHDRIILKGDVPNPMEPPSGCAFHPRCPKKTDYCKQHRPEMNTIGEGHQVACHLFGSSAGQ